MAIIDRSGADVLIPEENSRQIVEMVPQSYITLTDEGDIKNMSKMLEMFEDNDDVQNVWHNWENEE